MDKIRTSFGRGKGQTAETVTYATLAVGITAARAMVGGPIGAIAVGGVGKMVANAASAKASSFETTHGWKCEKGHEWHKWND